MSYPLSGRSLYRINAADLSNEKLSSEELIYLTQTKVDGQFVIRFQAGSFDMKEADADAAFDVIVEISQQISAQRASA